MDLMKLKSVSRWWMLFAATILSLLFLLVPDSHMQRVEPYDGGDYEHWMRDTIRLDHPIAEIALPGAHDAFTSNFTWGSPADPGMAKQGDTVATLASSPLSFLYRGLLIRYAKTQTSSLEAMLTHGVRYFDVRLSWTDQGFMTTHGFLGEPLAPLLSTFHQFLENHPGEIIIFHLQHLFDVREPGGIPSAATWLDLQTVFEASGLMNYVESNPSTPLPSITYGDLTANRTQAAFLRIGDNRGTAPESTWRAGPTFLRSTWHNTIHTDNLLSGIREETATILATTGAFHSQFRVLQGQKTAQLNASGAFATLASWSLLDVAYHGNPLVTAMPEFQEILHATPIVMFDAIDDNRAHHYESLMTALFTHNETYPLE